LENLASLPAPSLAMQTRSSNSPTNSGDDLSARKNAIWTVREEVELLNALAECKTETAGASFKEKAFAHAADKIQPFYERGARKDEKSCKTKWAHVCISLSVLYLYPD
jgi:hypothetical protein